MVIVWVTDGALREVRVPQMGCGRAGGPPCLLILICQRCPELKSQHLLLSALVAMLPSTVSENRFVLFASSCPATACTSPLSSPHRGSLLLPLEGHGALNFSVDVTGSSLSMSIIPFSCGFPPLSSTQPVIRVAFHVRHCGVCRSHDNSLGEGLSCVRLGEALIGGLLVAGGLPNTDNQPQRLLST